jgi:hypothetical protein
LEADLSFLPFLSGDFYKEVGISLLVVWAGVVLVLVWWVWVVWHHNCVTSPHYKEKYLKVDSPYLNKIFVVIKPPYNHPCSTLVMLLNQYSVS